MRLRQPWPVSRSRQRLREFEAAFGRVPDASLGFALELGGGDGFLAALLARCCRTLVTTDYYRSRLRAARGRFERVLCDAGRLPFRDGSVDFIFSSSVLEHVRARGLALAEMARCLKPGGVMVHIMPSRTWKILQLLLYYPHRIVAGIDLGLCAVGRRWRARRSAGAPSPEDAATGAPKPDRWSDGGRTRVTLRDVVRNLVPTVHGEYTGHLAELRGFGAQAWIDAFAAAGFVCHGVRRLPLYSGYGFGFERLRRFGERLGLSAHNALVLGRAGERPVPVDHLVESPTRS